MEPRICTSLLKAELFEGKMNPKDYLWSSDGASNQKWASIKFRYNLELVYQFSLTTTKQRAAHRSEVSSSWLLLFFVCMCKQTKAVFSMIPLQ